MHFCATVRFSIWFIKSVAKISGKNKWDRWTGTVTKAGLRRHCCPYSRVCLRLPRPCWSSLPSVSRLDFSARIALVKKHSNISSFSSGGFQSSRGGICLCQWFSSMFGFQVSHGSLLTCNILDFGSCSPNFLPTHVVWMNSWKLLLWECRRRPFWLLSLHSCCRMCLAAQSLAVALGPCISSAHVCTGL